MTTKDHTDLLQLEDLPPSVRQIIEDYEEELRKLRWQFHAVNGNLINAEKRLRIARATINVLRGVIRDSKHMQDMREKLKRKGVNPEPETILYNIIENTVTYGGPGYSSRTIHKKVVRQFVEDFIAYQKKIGAWPGTELDSMGCSVFYEVVVNNC